MLITSQSQVVATLRVACQRQGWQLWHAGVDPLQAPHWPRTAPVACLLDRSLSVLDRADCLRRMRLHWSSMPPVYLVDKDGVAPHAATMHPKLAFLLRSIQVTCQAHATPTARPEDPARFGRLRCWLQTQAAVSPDAVLRLSGPEGPIQLVLRRGQLVGAHYGVVRGERALARLLHGESVLDLAAAQHQCTNVDGRLPLSWAFASQEAAQLADWQPRLPSRDVYVECLADPTHTLPRSALAHTLCAQARHARPFGELIDACDAPDSSLLATAAQLLSGGELRCLQPAVGQRPWWPSEAHLAVLPAALMSLRPTPLAPARLPVFAADAACVLRLRHGLRSLQGFVSTSRPLVRAGRGLFGSIAQLRHAGVRLELFALPLERCFHPLGAGIVCPGQHVWVAGSTAAFERVAPWLWMAGLCPAHVDPDPQHPEALSRALAAVLTALAAPAVAATRCETPSTPDGSRHESGLRGRRWPS
ncbi:MAG: hypothetical protein ACPGUV_00195 [Polyangiales bacterium]